jgi:hypothetical protein
MTKKKTVISNTDILSLFFEQLDQVGTNQRGIVILTHGFIELLTNTIISARCKHGKTRITSSNRDYPHSVRLVLMNELGLIDDRLYRILDWFRKLRNRAAHDIFFRLESADLDFVNRSMDRFVPNVPEQKDLLRFCQHLMGTIWNQHLDVLQAAFSEKESAPKG